MAFLFFCQGFRTVLMKQRESLTNCIFDVLEKQNIRHVNALKYFLPMGYIPFFR